MSETSIVVQIVGDSGDGIQVIGEQLTITAATSGLEVRTMPDFPAEIRAPQGTLAGVSGFQLAMSEQVIFTAGESVDVLVALNPAALQHALASLTLGGLLILNADGFTDKDWQKAGLDSKLLASLEGQYQILMVPIISQSVLAVKDLALSPAQAKKTKNFYVLGLILWLFSLPTDHSLHFIEEKYKEKAVAQANQKSLLAGYNYAMTLELSRQTYALHPLKREAGIYRQLTGIDAVALALATVALKTKLPMLVAGYPITPASAILQAVTQLGAFGLALFQAEDEIAALCACLGAAFGGRLAVSCTSGPGFDLKTEALGLAVVAELPLVVINVQRAGASTGLPTKTGQSDLNQALHGRHGEAPIPVIAAQSPADVFLTVIEAFAIAIQHMTPVIVLLDAYLANAAEPWLIPDAENIALPEVTQNRFPLPYTRDDKAVRSWNVPGTPGYIHQLGGLEKQGEKGNVSYDAANHAEMVAVRAKKVKGVAKTYPVLTIEGEKRADTLIISWGSTYGSVRSALAQCAEEGFNIAHLHLRHLFPLPEDLGAHIKSFARVMVAELNTGHLWQLLRAEYLVDAQLITQCNGQPFSVSFLKEALLGEKRDSI